VNHPSVDVLIAGHAERAPDATAVVHGGTRLSYSELDAHADRLAQALVEAGVGPDAVVALHIRRDVWWVVASLAVLKAGGAYLAIDPDHPADRLRLLVTGSRAIALITEDASVPWAPADLAQIAVDTPGLASSVSVEAPDQCLAYVIYTSGSTGEPKPVALTRGGLAGLVAWHRVRHKISPADRLAQTASTSFDASVWEVWAALGAGAALYLASDEDRLNPPQLLHWLAEHRITSAFLATPLAEEILRLNPPDGFALRTLLTGGDALRSTPSRHARFELVNHYGPTETTVVATAGIVTEDSPFPPSIGRAIDGVEALVLDDRAVVAPGTRGELHLAGPHLARGYLHQPAMTAERFVPHPVEPGQRLYRTGDVVHEDPDGSLHFHGRIDSQLSVRGYRIEPAEVEHALLETGVQAACVVMHEEAQNLVGYVTGEDVDISAIRTELSQRLPQYMVPAVVVHLPDLPLNLSGKVDRAKLVTGPLMTPTATARPDDAVTLRVAELMAAVLGRGEIAAGDNFFALGGHSLLLTRLLAELLSEFAVQMPVRQVFEQPTASGIAALISTCRADTAAPRRISADDGASLSFPQRRLWYLHQLYPDLCAYNEHVAYRLRGAVDAAALQAALDAVVIRHESLRTGIEVRGGEPVQRIGSPYRVPLDIVDGTPEASVRRLAGQPFVLESGRMMRAELVRCGGDEHALVLSMHHVAADEWSVGILGRDLATEYAAALDGTDSRFPQAEFRYMDFAAWQQSTAADLAYWRRQLTGAPHVLELIADRSRPPVQGFAGDHVTVDVPPDVVARIGALARQLGATRFMVLLAAFQVLLHRYTTTTDIVVGSPVSVRGRPEFRDVVGLFVNTLVLRTDISGDPSFREVVARARDTTLDALTHQAIPFERLVEELAPDRDLSRNPLFQVVFAVEEESRVGLALPGVETEALDLHDGIAKFDLTLTVKINEDRMSGTFDFRVDLFDRETIAGLAGHFRELLAAVTRDHGRRISTLPMLPAGELTRLLTDWNDTARPSYAPGLVPEWVLQRAAAQPDALAVSESGRTVTYGELAARARVLARHLRSRGVGPETVVVLFLDRGVDLTIAMLGVHWAGGAYLPLDVEHVPDRLCDILEDSQAALVVSKRGIPVPAGIDVLLLDELPANGPQHGSAVPLDPDNLACVIYTSGSTGWPRGVEISHRGLANLVSWHVAAYEVDGRDRASCIAAAGFDVSAWETWPALVVGAALLVPSAEDRTRPDRLLNWLAEQHVTVTLLPTPLAEEVFSQPAPPDLALRLLLTGGDSFSRTPPSEAGYTVANHYGSAESTAVATAIAVDPADRRTPTVGRPIHNTRAYVLDQHMNPVPVGVRGDLYLAGDGLARGYLNRPRLTAEAFLPDPFGGPGERLYRTGDQARWRPQGTLEFLSHTDQQVKVLGFRIELGEVESVLRAYPGVGEAVVNACGHERGGRWLVGYFTGPGVDTIALRAAMQEQLPEYAVPAVLIRLDRLPTAANGKIDRASLPPPRSHHANGTSDPVERLVCAIWASVLGVADVGVDENFFALGGHSLLATQVVSRVGETFGVELPLRTLLVAPTVTAFAAMLREHESEAGQFTAIAELRQLVDDLDDRDVRRMLEESLAERTLSDE